MSILIIFLSFQFFGKSFFFFYNLSKWKETQYEKDNTLKKGEQVIVQQGEDGCTSETYKLLYKNGLLVSKTLVSKDTYNDLPTIIKKND